MTPPDGEDWLQRLEALATSRSCAGCQLCCTVMGVKELGKHPWRACAHLADEGCGIWGGHPGSCKSFTCLWRGSDSLLPPNLFPADCGFLLALDQTEAWPTVVKVCAEAGRPDAWDTPRYRDLFRRLAAAWNCPVAVVEEGLRARLVFAPAGRVLSRAEHPELFPHDGRGLALATSDYGPDRRPPAQRIAEVALDLSWT